jgi:hypothetical protein
VLVSNDTVKIKRSRRPRHSELSSQDAILAARAALEEQDDFLFGCGKLEAEFMELGLLTVAERYAAVDHALSEIGPKDRIGPQSPNNISFPPYEGEVLYAFTWKSGDFGSIYFKFCLAGPAGVEHLVLHSFHRERKKEEDEK